MMKASQAVGMTSVQQLLHHLVFWGHQAPARWEPPGPPPTWTSYTVNDKKHDAPEEEHIDNPGNWHLFSFRPKYDNKQKYLGHFTPAGAKVLNANSGGQRIIDGWQFYYNGWFHDDFDKGTYVRGEATQPNLKPSSRRGTRSLRRDTAGADTPISFRKERAALSFSISGGVSAMAGEIVAGASSGTII